jgi:ATP-dependent DNA helicase DinG
MGPRVSDVDASRQTDEDTERAASAAVTALDMVLAERPDASPRPGQQDMAAAVATAIEERTHLLVEAGTGTGKSLAYLVPALLSGRRLVVATATKTLQDQLAGTELPFLAGCLGVPVTWAVLKGRQSYACLAKLVEQCGPTLDGTEAVSELFPAATEGVSAVADWISAGGSGDRDDLPAAVDDDLWRQVSVSGMECPGKANCPQGSRCVAEAALDRARAAQVVVTNHHLYALHLSSGSRILPEHDVAVIDEAHRLEAALSSAFAVDVSGRRVRAFAANARRLVDPERGPTVLEAVEAAAQRLTAAIATLLPARVDTTEGELGGAILTASRAVAAAAATLRRVEDADPIAGAVARVQAQAGHLVGDFDLALALPDGSVAWAEPERAVVRVAPVEVDASLATHLLVARPTILTSATLTVGGSFIPLAARLGFLEEPIDPDPFAGDAPDPVARTYRPLRVEGSFDYARQGLLYVASRLPDPREDSWSEAAASEIALLTAASGGRALVLTTSHRMLGIVAARLAGAPFRVLAQGELPKKRLVAEFAADETSTLVATMGYWEGIDVPGRSLSLVVIDRIPFPRPDDPLMQARRDAVEARGGSPFDAVDLPHAAMLLAQGAGRLIRGEDDRGMVAVLDSRLTGRRYGQRLLRSLPRLQRTSDPERAVRYLRDLTEAATSAGP